MKGRTGKGPPSADLLVCFPSRGHLSLMPKPICSPARLPEPNKHPHNHHHHHNHHHNHQLHQYLPRKPSNLGGGAHASPLLWAKTKPTTNDISEPTSPKVTCAGQIKVRPKSHPCKNWQSVMEEIERLHNNRQHKKKPTWAEALGFKKEVMQFLTCLRNIKFDFRCFGSFPTSDIASDDDEDDDDEDSKETQVGVEEIDDDDETSRTVFSKWFMVLQENQRNGFPKEENKEREFRQGSYKEKYVHVESGDAPCAPPPNALLLMRCRSAPAKSRLEERDEEENDNELDEEEEEEEEEDGDENEGEERANERQKKAKFTVEEGNEEKRESLRVLMRYDTDFYKLSSDIAKETWIVGGVGDPFFRSRSCKR